MLVYLFFVQYLLAVTDEAANPPTAKAEGIIAIFRVLGAGRIMIKICLKPNKMLKDLVF